MPPGLIEKNERMTAGRHRKEDFRQMECHGLGVAREKNEPRPLIREQAFGEALDADKLERFGRYEVHLGRKLERMLVMLLRLKDLWQGAIED
jgi:hypothetical protein